MGDILGDEFARRQKGATEAGFDHCDVDDRLLEKILKQIGILHKLAMRFAQFQNAAGRSGRRNADLENASQKELEPTFPVSIESNRRQPVVVLDPPGFKEGTEIKQWTM